MKKSLVAALVIALVGVLGLTNVLAASDTTRSTASIENAVYPDQSSSIQQAVMWLALTHQNDDGGYASFSTGANQAASTVGGTLDAVLALGGAGYSASALLPGQSATPLGFLAADAAALAAYAAADGGQAGKLVLGLSAANQDPRSFVGHNFVISLTEQLEPSGAFSVADAFKQSLAIQALAAVNEPVPVAAVDWLISLQATNGSWDDGFGTTDNSDATAMAIMALLAAGESAQSAAIASAVAFLAQTQLADGSWEYGAGFGSSASSTALVAQALSALGEDWYSGSGDWAAQGNAPLDALLAWQSASGAFQVDFSAGPSDDFFTTVQVIPAIAGRSYPYARRAEAVEAALSCLSALQDVSGAWEQFAGGGPDAGGTSRAMQAIAAAGGDPLDARWTPAGGENAAAALESLTPGYLATGRGGRVGVVMQGVAAAGEPYDAADFAGGNLVLAMSGYLSPTGEYDSTAFGIFAHGEAMLGLLAVDEKVDPSAVAFLRNAQAAGDWGSADQNGMALQLLSGLQQSYPRVTLDVLRDTQLTDGGWGVDDESSPSSTSEVVQGLTAIGQNPFGPQWSVLSNGRLLSPADAVMAQQAESGCWPSSFAPGDDPYSTTDAIILLSQEPGWGFNQAFLPGIPSG